MKVSDPLNQLRDMQSSESWETMWARAVGHDRHWRATGWIDKEFVTENGTIRGQRKEAKK